MIDDLKCGLWNAGLGALENVFVFVHEVRTWYAWEGESFVLVG